ncbi:MAG: hypothetical protein H6811_07875 [Phycisphaeraceae bacterium]|nr:hypothetical protein [Phycisphaeraceae bacterium]
MIERPCPSCGDELKSIQADIRPECGNTFTEEAIEQALLRRKLPRAPVRALVACSLVPWMVVLMDCALWIIARLKLGFPPRPNRDDPKDAIGQAPMTLHTLAMAGALLCVPVALALGVWLLLDPSRRWRRRIVVLLACTAAWLAAIGIARHYLGPIMGAWLMD